MPDAVTEKTKGVKKDIKTYSALEAVKNSEGGQILLTALKKDIVACINKISSKYRISTHSELMAICAELSEKIAVFRTLSRSSSNKKMALEELQSILDENHEEDE